MDKIKNKIKNINPVTVVLVTVMAFNIYMIIDVIIYLIKTQKDF